jgi:two-component system, NtrC family, response regulator AtoC
MGKSKICIVEDDAFYAKMIRHRLSMDPDLDVNVYHDAESFLADLSENPQVVTLDHSLPDMSGLELLKKVRREKPNIQFIVLSAQEDITTAVELFQNGVYDYIVKDASAMDKLWHLVHKALERSTLHEEVRVLEEEVANKYNFQETIRGSSAPMQKVFGLLEKTAKTNITVTVTGETGTGKELVAKAIHFNSPRIKKPFVAVNVAAIPKELIESEMFGYEKGAFTGADQARAGKFEEADNGTLFLDEIGEMDLNMQSKLLRVLQEREVTRLGSNKVIPVDIRIVAATHRDLYKEVKEGRFREDLYYRLLGIKVDLPPLRERGSDILMLAKLFVSEFCKENKLPQKDFSPQAREKLLNYHYPGNVRELKAIIEIAAVMSEGKIIEEEDIQLHQSADVDNFLAQEMSLEEYTARIIRWYLDKYNNNVLKVAEKLDVGKSTIYRMIKEGKI